MKSTLILAATAALLAGTSAYAQTTVTDTTATVATTGDGATTQTTVAATAPTTKVVSQDADKTTETVTAGPIVSNGPVNTTTTITAADGTAVASTTTAGAGGSATSVTANAPVTTMTPPAMPMQTADAATPASSASLASFDTNNDGMLTPLEFGQMVLAAQAPASGAGISDSARYSKRSNNPATDVLNQTAAAFGKADTNRDFRVSAEELASWQSMGSPM